MENWIISAAKDVSVHQNFNFSLKFHNNLSRMEQPIAAIADLYKYLSIWLQLQLDFALDFGQFMLSSLWLKRNQLQLVVIHPTAFALQFLSMITINIANGNS